MAFASKEVRSVPLPTVFEKKEEVVLRMTRDEAQCLADVMACVGGDPACTRRVHTNAVAEALRGAGFKNAWPPYDKTGSIYFTEGKPSAHAKAAGEASNKAQAAYDTPNYGTPDYASALRRYVRY